MKKLNKTVSKILFSGILLSLLLLVGSCENWMSNDNFMEQIESEVHDANASQVSVYVRYANAKMGTTEPQGNFTMKVDVPSKISAVTSDDYGFVKWAAFSQTDFPSDKQHSKLTFLSEDDYNENYKSKELPASVIEFTDVKNPVTEVKVKTSRNDIFIIPIVTSRPSYSLSVPANADSNVVKNTSIRILFTKPIDKNTIYDSEGNLNISITSSNAVFTDDDSEMEANDITDLFDIGPESFSKTGKMLTLKLKEGALFDNRQRITVTLLEGLCDLYGFAMNGNYTFQFQTGTSSDDLAPMIEVLYGGTGDICDVFITFGEDGEMKGTATDEAKKAPKDINSDKYTDQIVAQRVYDKLNIFVKANDIINSGNAVINPAKDLSEDNVALIYIAAGLYIDSNGNPITIDENNSTTHQIGKKSYTYISGSIDANAEIKGQFTDLVPVDKDGNAYNSGTIYTYDVSNLPDGLIRIDVWAGDMTGNAGGPNDKGAPYYDKHDNSFKSIFVVKDTTPIDSAKVKEKKQVKSNSAKAPYYWYNKETLNSMELFDIPENKIHDAGHEKLRALDKNLWWTFKVGNISEKVLANDASWKRIHDEETGNTSLHYSLSGAKAPDTDGPVAITLYLKDDLNNLSEPVLLDSIMYDNTKPTVSLRADIGDFVNANGDAVLHASDDQVISQILKVDIGEANVDEAGSGIRRMEIHVTKDGNEVAEPLDPTKFAVKYAPSTIANPRPTSEGIRDIAIAADDIASTANIKVFNVTDANKITDGTLFIYGIKLGDADGTYQVAVDLYDSALNKTPETATTNFARDTTDPVINKVQVEGAVARVVYGQVEKSWWMPISAQDVESLSRVSFKLDISETGSGIKYIKLGKNIEFTPATEIKYGETTLVKDEEYRLNVANNTIELINWFDPILIDSNARVITLENVKLNNPNKTEGNEIAITADDFVSKTSGEKSEFFYDTTTAGTVIYADTIKPTITTLEIEDAATKTETNPYSLGYNNKYTDSQNVTLFLTPKAESLNNGSGIKTVNLSENAVFTNNTEIFVDTVKLSTGYEFAADGKSVTFEKVFTEANELKFTNVHIVSEEEGTQTVKAYLTDFVGLENVSTESDPIILDQVAPVITNIEWVAEEGVAKGSANSNEVKDQTFKVDFTEETSGTRVIKFDIDFEGDPAGTPSYDKPFDLNNFELKYGSQTLINGTHYNIKNDRYIELTSPKISSAGTFSFKNFKLRDSAQEGKYNIKVTLLDQAENINPQTESNTYSKKIFIDTTAPVVTKVNVLGARKRSVYNDAADAKQWWMPYSYFDGTNTLNKAEFVINVNEAGSGLKVIQLSDDVEFTDATELYVDTTKLGKDTEYTLDTVNHTIILKDYEDPKLRGKPSVFTLQNIKFKNINSDAGNKVGFAVEDWVTNTGNNGNKVYYPDGTDGTFIYADSAKPAIATLKIEDSAHNAETNPDTKAWDKENYTDSQKVILTLKLAAENTNFGSGVKIIHLSDNAEFTDGTTISVDGTPLTSGYHFATDKKSVEFDKVFVADNEIKFTNVNILNTTDGTQSVKAKLTDFVGLEAEVKTSDNSLIVDKENPVVSTVEWIPDNETLTTAGTTNRATIDDQTLKVTFTEATAGVKVIKFEINYENETSTYANPFDFENLKVYYDGNDTALLTKDVDYRVEDRYIILNATCKSNSFRFHGIKLKGTDFEEGTYTVKVTLQDAAERIGRKSETISIDTTEPVIVGDLRIPDLIQAVELTTEGTPVTNNYWLKKGFVNGTTGANGDTAQAPNRIPVYVTVKEKSSGVKVITFSEDVVLTSDTKLYLLEASDPSEERTAARTLIEPDKYSIDTDNHRIITITDKDDSKQFFTKYNSAGEEIPFILLFENVSFKKADSNEGASVNTISVTLSDVAKNSKTTSNATTAVASIYSDSLAPAAPENLTLKDRDASAATKTIAASTGYTNDSIVDMTFSLPASEQFGSGYHQFVLTGATFKNVGESNTDNTTNIATNATTVTMLSGTSEIKDLAFDISEDGKTLTLRKYGQAATEESKAVVRKAVSVTIKNLHLDNAETDGDKAVTLTAYDLTGWKSETKSASITLDTEKPELEKGVFAANYTNSSRAWYQPSINVYPHASGESATGVNINYGTQSYQKNIPTFYTATTYKTGYYQFNGVVSSVSSSQVSSPNTNFIHGAVLGIRGKDNIMLGGYNRTKTFLYYYKYTSSDTLFSKDEAQILAASTTTNPSEDINSKGNKDNQPNGDNSAIGSTLWFGFDEGQYSAVIVDEAGNVSAPFHFSVVRDVEKPAKEWGSGSSADSLNNRVLLQMPDASANIFTNSDVSSIRTSDGFPRFWGCGGTQSTRSSNSSMITKKYVTKKSSNKYKIQLNLGGTVSVPTLSSNINGDTAGNVAAYSDLTATPNSSPIEMYAVSTLYGSWPDADHPEYKYCPVVPSGTTFPSGQAYSNSSTYCREYFEYSNGLYDTWYILNSNSDNWHPYETGTSKTDSYSYSDLSVSISSYVDSNNNLIIEIPNTKSTVPISVFLKDGCGNMEYVVCGLYQEDNGYDVAISFVIDDKLGSAPTSEGVVTTPFILQFPYSIYDSSSNIQWGDYNFKLGDQSGNSEAPSSQDGTGGKRGFIKDKVKHATYYNPALYNTDSTLQFKHGFALHFYPKSADISVADNITGKESITFSDADWSETEQAKGIKKASDADIAAGNYTCRALMYCTNSTDVPTYAEIKECLDAETKRSPNQKTGQVTDWSYVQVSSSATEAILFVDYPKPDYKKLGWAQSNAQEIAPFYMWYIFEDAVGNYELAKVVNSAVLGDALTAEPSESSTAFDKWLYDGYGPELKINGTDIEVNKLGSTNLEAQVRKLIATNNGYVPYLNGSSVYVHTDNNMTIRSTSLKNSTLGYGTTRWVEDADDDVDYGTTSGKKNREYNPFVDLEVGELTGVRAFAWTKTSSYPSRSSIKSTDNTQGDSTSYWYAGYGKASTAETLDIGESYSNSDYPTTAYKNTTEYSGTYSGTLVNTIVPSQLLENGATALYLHVMDWTGNISTYRIGGYTGNSTGLSFVNDKTNPSIYNSRITSHEDGKYDVRYKDSSLTVRIANTTENVKVRFNSISASSPYYSDSSSSGYAGFSFVNYDIDTTNNKLKIGNDNNGPYLEIPYETYKNWTTAQNKTVYFYDNVGNITTASVKFIYDTTPPTISKVTLNVASGEKIADENGAYDSSKTYDTSNADKSLTPESGDFSCQEVYVSANKAVRFAITHDATNDFDKMEIKKWNDSESSWTLKTTVNGSDIDTSFDTLQFAYNETSNIFQILAYDYCGNVGCQYVKLLLDTAAPTIKTTPVITLGKGSINEIDGTYYYTAGTTDEEKLKIEFTASDVGVGTKYKYEYSLTGNSDDWHEIAPTADGSKSVVISLSSEDKKTLQMIYLRDCFGNTDNYTPGFKYVYGENMSVTPTVLTYYDCDAPSAPTISTSKLQKTNYQGQPVGTAYNVVNEIETRGKGLDNSLKSSNKNSWSKVYTEEISDRTILIKGQKDQSLDSTRSKVRILLPLSESANPDKKIIGYLKMEDVTSPSTTPGAYSFAKLSGRVITENNISMYEIIEDLPLGGDKTPKERYYYAVDVVGNISPALNLTYTYKNPHQVLKADIIEDPANSSDIPQEVKDLMTDPNGANITFAKIKAVEGGQAGDKLGIKYFNGDYLIVKCATYKPAGDDYVETPVKIELWDKWGDGEDDRRLDGESGPSDNPEFYKVFTSPLNTDNDPDNDDFTTISGTKYYWCYIAFKPGTVERTTHKETIKDDDGKDVEVEVIDSEVFTVGNFDNNDKYDGSRLYCVIRGQTTESEILRLDNSETKDYGWKLDNKGPEIDSTYVNTPSWASNEHQLHKYKTTGSIKIVKDNQIGENYGTNAYSKDMYIYIPKSKVYDRVTVEGKNYTYSGVAEYKTIETGGESDIDSGWNPLTTEEIRWNDSDSKNTECYKIPLPNIESIHHKINVYVRDNLGNESILYSLGNPDAPGETWWLVDNLITKESPEHNIEAVAAWADDAQNKFNITLPIGSIIKSVTAKVDGTAVTEGITVEFNGYDNGTKTPVLNGTDGWLTVKEEGLTVTLPAIEQKWHAQDVVIIINDDGNDTTAADEVSLKKEGFVPVRTLKDTDIKLTSNDNQPLPEKVNAGSYTIKIDAPVTITSVENETTNPSGITVGWNSQSPNGFNLNNVPQNWDEKDISVKINGVSKKVFTVNRREIAATDLTVTSDAEYSTEKTSYTLTIGTTTSAPLGRITAIEGINGEIATGAWSYNETDNKITATLTPAAQKLTEQYVSLKFTDDVNREIERQNVFTIKARDLTKDDLTVNHSEVEGVHTVTITINETDVPNTLIADEDIVVNKASIDGDITRNANTLSFKLKEIVAATWETQDVTVKIKELTDVKLFSVDPKAFTAENINVTVGDPTNNVYTLTINTTDNAPISKITKIEASEGTLGTDWTHDSENNKIVASLTIDAGYTDKSINLTFNKPAEGDGLVKAITILAKELTASAFVITSDDNKPLSWSPDANTTYVGIIIVPPEGITLTGDATVSSESTTNTADLPTIKYNSNNAFGIEGVKVGDQYKIIPSDLKVTVKVNVGESTKEITITLNNLDGDGRPKAPGAANNPRSIFGIRSGAIAYNSTATENAGDAPKTRRVSLTSWVSDLFNNDSEVAAETVKDEVKSTTAKAAKKTKKAQKAAAAKVEKAPVEKPVVTETVESVAVTSAAAVSEVVETVVETVANEGTIATVEEAAPEAKVSMTAVDASVTESLADDQAQSGAILWLALAALCAAVVGIVVLFLKNRAAKK